MNLSDGPLSVPAPQSPSLVVALSELTQLRANYIALEAYVRQLEASQVGVVHADSSEKVGRPRGPQGCCGQESLDGTAKWFLWSYAARLLAAPAEVLSQLDADAELDEEVGLMLKVLAPNDSVVTHFHRVLAFARMQAKLAR